MVGCRIATQTAPLHYAVRSLKARASEVGRELPNSVVPLLVVPFMGPTGRKLCAEEDCSWLDLSGNASIRAPGLRIHIEGKPNRFRRRGRPASSFAPKASRIVRHLLTHPGEVHSQRMLARVTGLDDGYVSRLVRNLADGGLVEKDGRAVRVTDPDLLLRAWCDEYDFTRHRRIEGHVPARDGAELIRRLADALEARPHRPPYAATGLAAAWCIGRFAAFRTASVYVHDESAVDDLRDLSFRETARGANVWLLVPDDAEGVFQGVVTRDGIHCVAPVQVYLDLFAHPERADDVAVELRRGLLEEPAGDG